MKNTHQEFSE